MSLSDLDRLSRWLENRQSLIQEFETVVSRVHSEPWPNFRVTGCSYDMKKGIIQPKYEGVPAGSYEAGQGYYPDRPIMVELAARTIAVRSRRWYSLTRTVRPMPDAWEDIVRRTFPFLPFLETGDGWSDLIIAMSTWISEIGVPEDFAFTQIKSKFGTGRFYCGGIDDFDQIGRVIYAGEVLSGALCEACGAPGRRRNTAWITTSCAEHAK